MLKMTEALEILSKPYPVNYRIREDILQTIQFSDYEYFNFLYANRAVISQRIDPVKSPHFEDIVTLLYTIGEEISIRKKCPECKQRMIFYINFKKTVGSKKHKYEEFECFCDICSKAHLQNADRARAVFTSILNFREYDRAQFINALKTALDAPAMITDQWATEFFHKIFMEQKEILFYSLRDYLNE